MEGRKKADAGFRGNGKGSKTNGASPPRVDWLPDGNQTNTKLWIKCAVCGMEDDELDYVVQCEELLQLRTSRQWWRTANSRCSRELYTRGCRLNVLGKALCGAKIRSCGAQPEHRFAAVGGT